MYDIPRRGGEVVPVISVDEHHVANVPAFVEFESAIVITRDVGSRFALLHLSEMSSITLWIVNFRHVTNEWKSGEEVISLAIGECLVNILPSLAIKSNHCPHKYGTAVAGVVYLTLNGHAVNRR